MNLDLHGHGFTSQILGKKVFGEADFALAFFTVFHGLDQSFKVFQSLTLAKGQVKAFGLYAFNRFAVFKRGKVNSGDLAVNSRARAIYRHKLGAVAQNAVQHFLHFFLVNLDLFLLHVHSFIRRQGKSGQNFKFNGIGKALAALKGVRRIHIKAGKRHDVELLHHIIDVHIDEVLTGFFINFVAEALLDDRGRNLALTETINLHGGFVQGDCAHNGGFDFLGFRGDDDLFSYRRNVFSAIFHVGLLFWVGVMVREGGVEPPYLWCWILSPVRLPIPPLSQSVFP